MSGVFQVTAACVGCGACLVTCPERVIRVAPARRPPLRVDTAGCTGCGECAEICPVDAFVESPATPAGNEP